MAQSRKTEDDHIVEVRKKLVCAALLHVPFDGWSPAVLQQSIIDAGVDPGLACQACPRGVIDLALAFHRIGDQTMETNLAKADLSDLRFRDKIAQAVRLRFEAVAKDKEAVRRGVSLFSLPQNAADGAAAIWAMADKIWVALGDTSEDVNWYTKRATLSAVYSATLLFWLGDNSENSTDTWAFLDRRIENVMQFEKLKARFKDSPFIKGFTYFSSHIRKPDIAIADDLPGKSASFKVL